MPCALQHAGIIRPGKKSCRVFQNHGKRDRNAEEAAPAAPKEVRRGVAWGRQCRTAAWRHGGRECGTVAWAARCRVEGTRAAWWHGGARVWHGGAVGASAARRARVRRGCVSCAISKPYCPLKSF